MDSSLSGSSVHHHLPEFAQILMSIESVIPSNHLILCCPLLLLPSVFPSTRVFSKESVLCIRWPSIGSSALALVLLMNIQGWFPSGLTGLISLFSKGLLESSPKSQFENISSLVLALFMVSTLTSIHNYQKTIALTIWTSVGKVMSLLFNMLSMFAMAFFQEASVF